jgi:hypothetical protein
MGFEDALCLGKGFLAVETDHALFVSAPEGRARDIINLWDFSANIIHM